MREMVKLKYIANSFSSSLSMDSVLDDGLYEVYGASGFIGYKNDYKVNYKYIGIIKDGAGVGRTNIYEAKTNILGTMAYIYPKNSNNTNILFVKYAIDAMNLGKGDDDKTTIPHIYFSKYGNNKIYHPSSQEQQAIANFLDKKCGEIDSLKSDIQKQIETLQEYKKSVITEAVTKGLNPNVEVKDSGIEWMGVIPKHWNIDKIKYHLKRNEPKNPGNAEVLSVYRDYGVIPKNSRDDNHNVTSDDTSKYKYVKKGDLVINKMKAWQGSMGVSEYEGIVSPAYFIFNFTDNYFEKKYFHFLIRNCYKDEFRRISGGIREGQWDLPADLFANELVLIPPIEEQIEIVEYLKLICVDIDGAIEGKNKQLETLEQYKKSLIYEYVTGKKEVSNDVAK